MRFDKNEKRVSGKEFTDSFGTVNLTNKEAKEEHFGEICRAEDAKIVEAERGFHARMTQKEKEDAAKWIGYFRYMVGGVEKE